MESVKRQTTQTITREFREYGELPDDWDGDNGYAPALSDIENALAFMNHIPEEGIASAELMVAGDGDVGFCWEHDNHYLEIGFQDGSISFYGETSKGEEIDGDEVFSAVSVPQKLDYLMKSVFGANSTHS